MADFLYLGVFRLLAVGILSQQTVDTLQMLSSPHWPENALSRGSMWNGHSEEDPGSCLSQAPLAS